MDDYDTCFERAKDEPAFSNGTEGYGWIDANCSFCINDKPAREGDEGDEGDEGNGCPLILVAFMQRTPVEWLEGDRSSIACRYTCVMYRHEDDGGDPEPKPIPDPPGQLTLFPRDGFEGVRMLKAPPSTRPAEVPAPLPGHPVEHGALRRACADVGVPLRDRYGFAIPDEHLAKAVRIARCAETLTAAGEALECAVLMGELEIASPTSLAFPIGPAHANALAEVLRSSVGPDAAGVAA